ncbi:MAG: hypothetical protein IK088_06030 [Lachnospiraceae bacterium]|nr:hypothetical protein [Lachnospiraceae bacterium]
MIGLLIRKQLREQFSFLFREKKGRQRSKGGAIALLILLGFSYLSLGMAFFGLSFMLAESIPGSESWLYFSMMGTVALGLGLFGSVLITYQTLYKARDNEMLLSMPIPPWKILLSRMTVLVLSTLLFEALVIVPAAVVYFIEFDDFSLWMVFSILISLVSEVLATMALSFFLSFLVAKAASHIRNKQVAIVILTVLFLGGYYTMYFNMQTILRDLMDHIDDFRDMFSTYIFPLYVMGQSYEGELLSFLGFCGFCIALFALTYFLLSKTFIRLAIRSDLIAKTSSRHSGFSSKGLGSVLLTREFKHLAGNASYMLNGCFSSLIMTVGAVFILIQGTAVREAIETFLQRIPFFEGMIPILVSLAVSLVSSLNIITAPSISIEGKTLWILKTLPIDTKKILKAKLYMHWITTMIPAGILIVVLGIVLRLAFHEILLALVFVMLMIVLFSLIGMLLGIRMPVLDWDNEATAVKTGAAVTLSSFMGFMVLSILAPTAIGIGVVFGLFASPDLALVLLILILAGVVFLFGRRLFTRGVVLFNEL